MSQLHQLKMIMVKNALYKADIYIYIYIYIFLMRPFGELSAFISRYPKNPPSRLEAEKLSANKVLVETICSRADSHCNYNLILGWQETGC